MFNLLPNNLKEDIKSEYRYRLFVVVSLSVLFVQVTFFMALIPSWFTSAYKENDAISQVEKANQSSKSSDSNSITSTISTINNKLVTLNSSLEYRKIVPVINIILSKKTNEIVINKLYYSSNSASTSDIKIEGVSATRESLLAFVNDLKSTGSFGTVDSPISNFTRDKNINFSIVLTNSK